MSNGDPLFANQGNRNAVSNSERQSGSYYFSNCSICPSSSRRTGAVNLGNSRTVDLL
tara:strand:- start:61 stop:231 length:171 start_codon:yes stop_codon:yes gene_type:complete